VARVDLGARKVADFSSIHTLVSIV
jgi:hypothetical protein